MLRCRRSTANGVPEPPWPRSSSPTTARSFSRLVEKVLEAAGHTVVTARDGLEAVEKAFAEDPEPGHPRRDHAAAQRATRPAGSSSTSRQRGVCPSSSSRPGTSPATASGAWRRGRLLPDQGRGAPAHRRARAEHPERRARAPPGRAAPTARRRRWTSWPGSTSCSTASCTRRRSSPRRRGPGRGKPFDEAFTAVMGLIAQVVDHTLSAFAFVEGGELEMVVYPARPAAPGLAEELKARVLEAAAANAPSLTRVAVRMVAPTGGRPRRGGECARAGGHVPGGGRRIASSGLLAVAGKERRPARFGRALPPRPAGRAGPHGPGERPARGEGRPGCRRATPSPAS